MVILTCEQKLKFVKDSEDIAKTKGTYTVRWRFVNWTIMQLKYSDSITEMILKSPAFQYLRIRLAEQCEEPY